MIDPAVANVTKRPNGIRADSGGVRECGADERDEARHEDHGAAVALEPAMRPVQPRGADVELGPWDSSSSREPK